MGGASEQRACVCVCVRTSVTCNGLMSHSCHPPQSLGTRLTTSALLHEAVFPFSLFSTFDAKNCVLRLVSACACA
jgi:hypothetical protein